VLRTTPRIGVLSAGVTDLPDRVREAGGEPVPLILPSGHPRGGVALVREWVADVAEISWAHERLDALLLSTAESPEKLAGLLIAALRLNLPTVAAPTDFEPDPFSIVPYALGLAPLDEDPAEVAVARSGVPLPRELIEGFSLANALRAGCSLEGVPETIVHLAAVAREAGVVGFSQMIRVLVPETPAVTGVKTAWYLKHRAGGLLAHLGESLHDTRTVEGRLREILPPAPPAPSPPVESRLVLVRGRVSGTEALCRVMKSDEEIAGECRVQHSEKFAVRVLEEGFVEPNSLLVVGGCGPRGGPGLLRLDRLAQILREDGLEDSIAIITDGLPPKEARGTWVSLVSPEAAAGGVIGRLRDGDTLRIDLAEGRIRTGVKVGEIEGRDPYEFSEPAGAGYAARYARSALPALEGGGFG
jgi:dihydroxy-acid dehydratase